MATEAMNQPATDRQIACIARLRTQVGKKGPEIETEMSKSEASSLIKALLAKSQKDQTRNGRYRQATINEPRLGMAMKECYRLWAKLGLSVYAERREQFIKTVIKTYKLFTEIAERLQEDAT